MAESVVRKEGPRSFAVLLAGMRDENEESVNDEASAKLQELITGLREKSLARDGKVSGEFTLSLKVAVLKGRADVIVDIGIKEPKAKGRELSLWVSKGGNLLTETPQQQRLPLEAVAARSANTESDGGEFKQAKEI